MLRKVLSSLFISAGLITIAVAPNANASTSAISDAGFESGSLDGWQKGTQTGSLTSGSISGGGTGVTLISSAVAFNAPARGAVGSPTLPDGSPNPYYQPAVIPTTWSFAPYGAHAAALQPRGQATFDAAMTSLGLSSANVTALKSMMTSQAAASGYGSGSPTDAAWITRQVTLSAGVTYTMSWNYIGTDYVPFNDGSLTSLVPVTASAATVTVNNQNASYALLGFTNPGTGDYSTGTYGSTGWQVSTYEVSESGEYVLGFAVFNLDDTSLSPVLLVDSQPGATTKNGESFGGVAPNNPDAPSVVTTTIAPEPDPTTTTAAPEPEPESTTTVAPEPESTTTVAPEPEPTTTTAAPAPATTQPQPQPQPVHPPIFTPEPTTTVPVTDVTTTVVVATPDTESPTTSATPGTLPVTGSGNSQTTIVLLGFILVFIGGGILLKRRDI